MEEYLDLKKIEYYHKEYLRLPLKGNQIDEIASKFSNIVLNKVIKSKFVPGAKKFLKYNYQKYLFYISTGTPEDEILYIINKLGLKGYFKSILGSPMTKHEHLLRFFKGSDIKKDNIIFVGDADTDKIAAKQFGVTFVARMHETNSELSNEKFKIKDINDLKEIISKIENHRI